MDKGNTKIIIRTLNELKEHLSSDIVQNSIITLKEISSLVDAKGIKPLEYIDNKYGVKNIDIDGWLAQGGKYDESGEYELEVHKDDTIITIMFNIYSETSGKYDQDPTLNTEETDTDIEIDSVMFSIPEDDQLDVPVTDEVKKYTINIINYINK